MINLIRRISELNHCVLYFVPDRIPLFVSLVENVKMQFVPVINDAVNLFEIN